jgi:hypothetical protein
VVLKTPPNKSTPKCSQVFVKKTENPRNTSLRCCQSRSYAKSGLLVGKIESWEYLGANFREMGIFARIQYSVFSIQFPFLENLGYRIQFLQLKVLFFES